MSESQTGTPSVLPRPDFHFTGQVGRTYLESDPAQFPQPVQAPEGAPNILLILIDDCGFGQYGAFGGGIPSPTMDKLAAEGLRYNHFHTTALCIGMDVGSPINFTYQMPFEFTGKIAKVDIELKAAAQVAT